MLILSQVNFQSNAFVKEITGIFIITNEILKI